MVVFVYCAAHRAQAVVAVGKSVREAENLRAVADLTDYNESAGTYIVDVKIYVDGASNVGAVGDYQISVELKKG